jgi:hypothetical protein
MGAMEGVGSAGGQQRRKIVMAAQGKYLGEHPFVGETWFLAPRSIHDQDIWEVWAQLQVTKDGRE